MDEDLRYYEHDYLQAMENSNVVSGRTWQSLKERYLKVIRKNLLEKPNKYGLDTKVADKLVAQ